MTTIFKTTMKTETQWTDRGPWAFYLAPPAERLRSFSNADSSVVVVRRPSSTFQLKAWFLKNCLITFFLFWHVASLGWYQCIVKIWIWLNHSKGHFSRSKRFDKGQIWLFLLLFANLLKSGLITFLYFLHTASLGWYWSTVKRWFSLNNSKGHFQGRKGQV